MKTVILLLIVLFAANNSFAQSNYVSTFLDNPDPGAATIFKSPWDENVLYQAARVVSTNTNIYEVSDVSNGSPTPVAFPLCSELMATPTVVADGFLLSAITSFGVEFVYFDGNNSTVFDLNVGASGSDPYIFKMDDRVFIFAFDGSYQQLFEFDKITHTVTKVSTDAISVFSVCASWGSDIFYKTKAVNTVTGEDEYSLVKATPSGNGFMTSILKTITIPTDPNRGIYWLHPVVKWGKLYLSESNTNTSFGQGIELRILSIDASDQIVIEHEELQSNTSAFVLLDWNGSLTAYSKGAGTVLNSVDGSIYTVENTVPVDEDIVEHYITENDLLYFKLFDLNGINKIYKYENGFLLKHTGEHLHLLLEDSEVLYFSDYRMVDSSSLVLLYTGIDVVDEVNVIVGSHSPVKDAALMFNGFFTFLHSNGGVIEHNNIMQLVASPQAGVEENSIEMSIYPNPINGGGVLTIRALRDGEVELINTSGSVLKRFDIENGLARLNTSLLSPGVYFVSFMDHTQRIVVN